MTVALAVDFSLELVATIGRLGPKLLTATVLVVVLFRPWTGARIAAEVARCRRSRRDRVERYASHGPNGSVAAG